MISLNTVIGAVLIAIGFRTLGRAMMIAILGAAGFASSGVTLGSIAATFQSAFLGAFTGGFFSVLQSVGATAVAPTVGTIIAGIASMASGASVLVHQYWNRTP